MSETKRGVYGAKIRKRAAAILAGGAGHRALAAQLKIPEATARQWSRAYAVGGEEAVLNAGSRHRTYPLELKIAVAQDRVDRGKTTREVMVAYGVPSESSVKSWCRQYRAKGIEGLIGKQRGRKQRADGPACMGATAV